MTSQAKIKTIKAREILSCNGAPTVECLVVLENGALGVASVPSGVSVGSYEAKELRDSDPERFWGMGVKTAVDAVNQIIAPKLYGLDGQNQKQIDQLMIQLDGTPQKKKLGANSILSVSMAVAKAAAMSLRMPLFSHINQLMQTSDQKTMARVPIPMVLLLEGGQHGAENLNFQEFLLVPAPARRRSYSDSLAMISQVYHALARILGQRKQFNAVGQEGGFVPNLYTNADALDLINQAVTMTQFQLGGDVFISLDIAASSFYKNGQYTIKDRTTSISSADLAEYYKDMISQYRILSLEDPFAEDDWRYWTEMTRRFGSQIMVVGDDLIATNKERLQKAVKEEAINSVIIKPNQIGTLSETLQVVQLARSSDFEIIVSHRAGDTNDTFIVDLAVGVGAHFVKFGALVRGERVAKYNRLLEIEYELS